MIKCFCDRCGKECKELRGAKIPGEKTSFNFTAKTVQLCSSCKKDADNLYDKLTDIRFTLFRDFMKGGEG